MKVKDITDEDFSNYKLPSMFIATCYCNWKCCEEANIPITICQNEPIARQPNIEVPTDEIFRRYSDNPITQAVVVGGLEPILQFNEVLELIETFRNSGDNSMFVIYTGYYPEEISHEIDLLSQFKNVILKVGRFVPGQKPHKDKLLGVNLISDNQYAIQIS